MVSIIIPIYNAGNKLNRMLSSIVNQIFKDFEVLLIDDGSTDCSAEICKKYEREDSRFHYFYRENAGVSAARNFGLSEAKGEYIAFLDADDQIDEGYFEELVFMCASTDIAVCDVICEDERGKELSRFSLECQVLSQEKALNYLFQRQGINSGPCAKIFKRKIVENLQFPPLKAYEDILFVKEAFYRAKEIAVLHSVAYHYIQNEQGAMNQFLKTPNRDIVLATDILADSIIQDQRLEDACLYITLSHLYQYVIPLIPEINKHLPFVMDVQHLFRKYLNDILKNKAFPWKEKIVYGLFSYGWIYTDKKFKRIKN